MAVKRNIEDVVRQKLQPLHEEWKDIGLAMGKNRYWVAIFVAGGGEPLTIVDLQKLCDVVGWDLVSLVNEASR